MFERTIARPDPMVEIPDSMGDAGAGDPNFRLRLEMINKNADRYIWNHLDTFFKTHFWIALTQSHCRLSQGKQFLVRQTQLGV